MDKDLILAHLNLYAVLQNLEELVSLDAEMAALARDWSISIQFSVRNGPSACLDFAEGRCKHSAAPHSRPAIRLFFTSPQHLNRMFEGKANPIPLRGFTHLGFLKKDFSRLTDRLAYYLKPENGRLADESYLKTNTTLTLYTAAYAVKELALLEPTCKKVASSIPLGTLQIGILPDGPNVHLDFKKDGIGVGKGAADGPMATMMFRDMQVANALLNGRLDAFQAVADGDVLLRGIIPMIDNVGLILDRVPVYLA